LNQSLLREFRVFTARRSCREVALHDEHRRATTEGLLAIPDAFAWCWAKGSHWRTHIRSVVTVKGV
jgi:hypothetical protein